jgi:hypothetical protein
MKKILLLLCILCAFVGKTFAQTTYDVFTYTEPKDYTKSEKTDNITYTKTDNNTGSYCIIALYKQNPAIGELQTDFDIEWKDIPVASLGVTETPVKENSKDVNGWKSQRGKANFIFNNQKSIAQLIIFQKNKTVTSIFFVTNNTQLITKELDPFLSKLKLSTPTTITTNTPNAAIKNHSLNTSSSSKIDVWMFLKYSARTSDYYPVGSIQKEFYAVFSNNDYYPYYPTEGMGNLNNANKQNDSWGKFSVQGNKITIQSKYENETLNKKTSTIYEKPNATFLYYKCARVDGLTLLGGWTYDKGWRENRYNQGDCRPVIYFGTDGSFIDRGAFLYACGSPSTNPKDQPGQGTYSINNFTLTLKYKDGRTISKAFCGNFDKNPTVENSLLHIGNTPFYKDIN